MKKSVKPVATNQGAVNPAPDSEELPGPTAEELGRLILAKWPDRASVQAQKQANCFARLLNRGSSME
jgi:hypothetical protein